MNPEKAKHETYIDVHPTSGLPLASLTRTQLNAFIRRDDNIEMMSQFPDQLILPFLWTEEGHKTPSDKMAEVAAIKFLSAL